MITLENIEQLQTDYNKVVEELDMFKTDKESLGNQLTEANVKITELTEQLKSFGDNPEAVAKLVEVESKVQTLETENAELKNKLEEFQANLKTDAGRMAAEIIARGKVNEPIPVSNSILDANKTGDSDVPKQWTGYTIRPL